MAKQTVWHHQSGGSTYANGQDGTIFSYDLKTGEEHVLYAFKGGKDGSAPSAGLTPLNGLFYGTTSGETGVWMSTIFSFDPAAGVERMLHQLTPAEGKGANGLVAVGGILYGTASGGGFTHAMQCAGIAYGGCGTLFSFDPKTRHLQVTHTFAGQPDGSTPQAGPVEVNGTLYGTTAEGGDPSFCGVQCGTVYAVDIASGQERIVYSFGGGIDGESPRAPLIYARGKLYGTTASGGNGDCEYEEVCGTVFSVVPSTGLERIVYRFGAPPDGTSPATALFARHGVLYGTTQSGGNGGAGTIFSIDIGTRQETTIYGFPHRSSGSNPYPDGDRPTSPLIFVKGVYYGTTSSGGATSRNGAGTLFSLTP